MKYNLNEVTPSLAPLLLKCRGVGYLPETILWVT
jgi:hypothetical protein